MKKRSLGFTLIELSIVIAILSIMIGGIMAAVTQQTRLSKMAEVKRKMDVIEEKLFDYAKANSRIPCPASGTFAMTSGNFGAASSASTGGTRYCLGGIGLGTADWTYTTGGVAIAGGVVPIRTLGLPDEYAFDPWGGRFTYIVDTVNGACSSAVTANNGCGVAASQNAFALYNAQSINGYISVDDTGGNARVTSPTGAILAIISHGPNGHGAFQLGGTRKNAGSNNTYEQANCRCNSSATYNAGSFAGILYQGPNTITTGNVGDLTYTFDDIVRFYVRSDFVSAADQATEPNN